MTVSLRRNYTEVAMSHQKIALRTPQGDFKNEPFLDFSLPANSDPMKAALESVALELGREYDLVIGGERRRTREKIRSTNPSRPAQLIGLHQKAGLEHVEPAIQAASLAFESWRLRPAAERAALLLRAAEILRRRKFEFRAWLVYEAGKNWAEADADAGEAIDFLEFYARESLRLADSKTPIQYPGERCELHYVPLGVGAIIPPWNFPLAILAGMTAAAIVCGNTVVLKPSSDTPTIAAKFYEVLEEAGLPPGVVNLCPGAGAEFGNALVEHPKIRFISFTGSKAAGLEINARVAQPRPGQIWIKRAILEMGGKDSILVCADADLDAAAGAVCASAFGFSGQKCSACSRAIVEAPVYDAFLEKLIAQAKKLTVGNPVGNANLGPVVNSDSLKKILRYIGIGKKEGRLVSGGQAPATAEGGYYVEPTIFADVAPDAALAQEEIFGPVLAVIKAKDFEDGLHIANNTEYGLTGSLYTSDEKKKAAARSNFHVGNLYFNRKCTGAMVGAHPFGGFNLSGTDSKAGGADYLLLFTQAKSVAERLG
jgi:1-pyrroline-5-carboxylate dehydrogenase